MPDKQDDGVVTNKHPEVGVSAPEIITVVDEETPATAGEIVAVAQAANSEVADFAHTSKKLAGEDPALAIALEPLERDAEGARKEPRRAKDPKAS